MALAVTVAEVEVLVLEAVGFDSQVNAPAALTPPDLDKQKYMDVLAPFAEIEPFKVAEVAAIEEALLVVAVGTPATIVRVKVFVAVAAALSVTRNVRLVELAVTVGVPVMWPTVPSKVNPEGNVPEVISHKL